MRRINNVAGIAVAAPATIINDNGNVTSARLSVIVDPMMPPSVTREMVAVAEIIWQAGDKNHEITCLH